MKKIFAISVAIFIGIFISAQTAYAAFPEINISGLDTIANFGTVLKAGGVLAGSQVNFSVKNRMGLNLIWLPSPISKEMQVLMFRRRKRE